MNPEPADMIVGGRFLAGPERKREGPVVMRSGTDQKTGRPCRIYEVPAGTDGAENSAHGALSSKLLNLRHPSLENLQGLFNKDPGAATYWVYEAAEGKSFSELAAEGRPFSEPEAVGIAAALCGALKKLHGPGYGAPCGTVSPRNLYLTGNGRPVLAGIKPFEGRSADDAEYSPPGERPSNSGDLYALGASLAFLLTRKKLSELRNAGGFSDIKRYVGFSREFCEVLAKMTAVDQFRRYRCAEELEADLAVLLSGKPPSILRAGLRSSVLLSSLAAAALGAWLLFSGGGEIKVLKAGKVGWAEPGGLTFNHDGSLLALAGDTSLYIWDTRNWRRESTDGFANGPGNYTRSVAFLPDGGILVGSSSGEGVSDLRLVSSLAGERSLVWKVPLDKTLDSVAVSADGRLIAAAVNAYNRVEERRLGGEITVFDMYGKVLHKPALAGGPVFSVNFTPDGGSLVYKTYFWDQAAKAHNFGRFVQRHLDSGTEDILGRDKTGPGSGLFSYSPGGLLAVPAGYSEVLDVLDPTSGRRATLNQDSYKEKYAYTISAEGVFSRDLTLFAAHFTSRNRVSIRLFETERWRVIKAFRLGSADKGGVAGLAFDPGGRMLAAAQGNAFVSKVHVFSLDKVAAGGR